MIVDWVCKACKRQGVAIVIHDDPKSPGERAYAAHESMLAGRAPDPRPCKTPSITWKARP